MAINILIILVSSVALVKSVSMFIEATSKLGHHFKISAYTISFLLVALGTSLPEAAVAVSSGLKGQSILAFGNSIGSNIALMTIIVAIPAIFTSGLVTREAIHSRDIYYTALFSALPLGLILDGTLNRADGIILLGSYLVYSIAVLRRAKGLESIIDTMEHTNIWVNLLEFTVSLGILIGSSQLLVNAAINLSVAAGIELGVVGLTLTAIGTSLPEIAFSIAALKNHKDEIVGDVIGSVVANSTLVLGLASALSPINLADFHSSTPTILVAVLVLLIFLRFVRTKEKIDTAEGLMLAAIYLLFVAGEFLF